MKTGIELIADERQRQVTQEGWTPEHDDTHTNGELAGAGACYAAQSFNAKGLLWENHPSPTAWPWSFEWWKPSTDPVRNLVKAGALIAAEIDRLQRIK